MSEFSEKLGALCSFHLAAAKSAQDGDAIGEMIERLAHSLAFTIAMASDGDADRAQNLLTGAESYIYETAASFGVLGRIMKPRAPNPPRKET